MTALVVTLPVQVHGFMLTRHFIHSMYFKIRACDCMWPAGVTINTLWSGCCHPGVCPVIHLQSCNWSTGVQSSLNVYNNWAQLILCVWPAQKYKESCSFHSVGISRNAYCKVINGYRIMPILHDSPAKMKRLCPSLSYCCLLLLPSCTYITEWSLGTSGKSIQHFINHSNLLES